MGAFHVISIQQPSQQYSRQINENFVRLETYRIRQIITKDVCVPIKPKIKCCE